MRQIFQMAVPAPSNLESLLRLVLAHKKNHDANQQKEEENMTRCKTTLTKLRKVLPKLMRTIVGRAEPTEITHLCELLTLLLSGDVCPHSLAFFRDGESSTVLPMLFSMLPVSLMEEDVSACALEVVCQLLSLIRQSDLAAYVLFFEDTVVLISDLILLIRFIAQTSPQSDFRLTCYSELSHHMAKKNSIDIEKLHSDGSDLAKKMELSLSAKEVSTNSPNLSMSSLSKVHVLLSWVFRLCEHIVRNSCQFIRNSPAFNELFRSTILLIHQDLSSLPDYVVDAAIRAVDSMVHTHSISPHQVTALLSAIISLLEHPKNDIGDVLEAFIVSVLHQKRNWSHIFSNSSNGLLIKSLRLCRTSKLKSTRRVLSDIIELELAFIPDRGLHVAIGLFDQAAVPEFEDVLVRALWILFDNDSVIREAEICLGEKLDRAAEGSLPRLKRQRTLSQMHHGNKEPVEPRGRAMKKQHKTIVSGVIDTMINAVEHPDLSLSGTYQVLLRAVLRHRNRIGLSGIIRDTIQGTAAILSTDHLEENLGYVMKLAIILLHYFTREEISFFEPVLISVVGFIRANGPFVIRSSKNAMRSDICDLIPAPSKHFMATDSKIRYICRQSTLFQFVSACSLMWDLYGPVGVSHAIWGRDEIDRCIRNSVVESNVQDLQEARLTLVMVFQRSFELGVISFENAYSSIMDVLLRTIPCSQERSNCRDFEAALLQLIDLSKAKDQITEFSDSEHSRIIPLLDICLDSTKPGCVRAICLRCALWILSILRSDHIAGMRDVFLQLLKLIRDSDPDVRHVMMNNADKFVSPISTTGGARLIDIIFPEVPGQMRTSKLAEFFDESIRVADASKDDEKFEAALVAIGSIGCACDRSVGFELEVLLWALFRLINVWSWSRRRSCCAYDQIERILAHQNTSWRKLCIQFPERTYPKLVRQLLSQNSLKALLEVLFGNEVNAQVFLEACAPYVLPEIVLNEDERLLTKFAVEVSGGQEERPIASAQIQDLLLGHIEHIIKELIISQVENTADCTTDEFSSNNGGWKFILRYMPKGTSIDSLIGHSPHRVLNALAWELAGPRKRAAKKAFLEVSSYLRNIQDQSETVPRKYFLALMTDLGRKLATRTRKPLQYRQRALRCIRELLILFGNCNLDPFAPKVMAILKVALQENGLKYDACVSWDIFVRMLSKKSLVANLCTIVVSLLGCIIDVHDVASLSFTGEQRPWRLCDPESTTSQCDNTDNPVKGLAVSILKFLFVDKRSVLKHSFCKVSFLPNIPELAEIRSVLDEEMGKPSLEQLTGELSELITVLHHWNGAVREVALSYLLQILVNRTSEIHTLINAGEKFVHPVISKLLQTLLRLCCTESKDGLKLLCAECLGAIGAIDPSRMPLDVFYNSSHYSDKRSSGELSMKQLACTLIENQLANGLRAAPENTDSIAFAIQELLRFIAEHHGDKNSKERQHLMPDWMQRRFDQKEVLDILEPYWSTSYTVAKAGGSSSETVKDDPGSLSTVSFYDASSSYEGWLVTWCKYLIKLSSYPERRVFQACRTALSSCPTIARFLLPYLIQNVLRSGKSSQYDQINGEVLAVLRDHDYIGTAGSHNEVLSLSLENDMHSKEGEFTSSSRHHQCAQAIFSTLDELTEWSCRKPSKTDTGVEVYDQEKENLKEFLQGIPKRILAEAAFSIRAYARSLQYFETYLRQQGASPVPLYGKMRQKDLEEQNTYILQISSSDASFLQKVYSCTDEPDGLIGLATHRRLREARRSTANNHGVSLNLLDRITDYENLAQWDQALLCYEQVLQDTKACQTRPTMISQQHENADTNCDEAEFKSQNHLHAGSIRCMIMLGRLEGALQNIDGILSRCPKALPTLYPFAVECAWRLSRWDFLDTLITDHSNMCQEDPVVRLGNVLLSFHRGDEGALQKSVQVARSTVMGPLAAASVESYQRTYPLLQRLHMLHEVEQGFLAFKAVRKNEGDPSDLWERQSKWAGRFDFLAPSVKFREPVLALRRVMLQELGQSSRVAQNWLLCAKMARNSGHWQTAASAVMHARVLRAPTAIIEDAKILHAQGNIHGAVELLEPIPIDVCHISTGTQKSPESELKAKTLLLTTNWIQESHQKQGDQVIKRYNAVVRLRSDWEKGYFCLARYYDTLLQSVGGRDSTTGPATGVVLINSKSSKRANGSAQETMAHVYLTKVLENYVHSLRFGVKHLFQALPRFLTLWFEYGDVLYRKTKPSSSTVKSMASLNAYKQPDTESERQMADLNNLVALALKHLPAYQWFACLPQVTSRICHPNPTVVEGVKRVTNRVLVAYPKQALWLVLGLSKSQNQQRQKRALDIVSTAQRSMSTEASASVSEAMRLFDDLIKVARCDPENNKKIDIQIGRLHTRILMPVKESLQVTLPFSGEALSDREHRAFPIEPVFIKSVYSKADVMVSKEKPKKLKLLGSNGETYNFLCKQERHGDLRKDARMMDINTMINRLLQRSAEGRKRKLRLRTYAVICLNEDSGLMEWVNHTTAMRRLISQIYRTESGAIPLVRITRDIKECFIRLQEKYAHDIPTMARLYRRNILSLPVFTPRFHQWFLNTFSDPTAWFESRLAFSRSAAVWSMVGHIVGLGDRHCENILIDCSTGECVHVDFDCLFDKGLKLNRPEIVPFRLTPNMIDAFGLTGYEGVYREVSEVTMQLLRQNRPTLMSVLESFLHDPLVEWSRGGKVRRHRDAVHSTFTNGMGSSGGNEEAKAILKTIDQRLRGIYNFNRTPKQKSDHDENLPLSVHGQVECLIQEAVSDENLAQMYIGWMPFI